MIGEQAQGVPYAVRQFVLNADGEFLNKDVRDGIADQFSHIEDSKLSSMVTTVLCYLKKPEERVVEVSRRIPGYQGGRYRNVYIKAGSAP